MHKNTFLLVIFLSVFAALIIGVNFGKYIFTNPDNTIQDENTNSLPTPTPIPELLTYTSRACNVKLGYPDNLIKVDAGLVGSMLIDADNPDNSIAVICQKNMELPPQLAKLSPSDFEEINIGTVSALLFRSSDASQSSKIIFNHPGNKSNVLISIGTSLLNQVLPTISLF